MIHEEQCKMEHDIDAARWYVDDLKKLKKAINGYAYSAERALRNGKHIEPLEKYADDIMNISDETLYFIGLDRKKMIERLKDISENIV